MDDSLDGLHKRNLEKFGFLILKQLFYITRHLVQWFCPKFLAPPFKFGISFMRAAQWHIKFLKTSMVAFIKDVWKPCFKSDKTIQKSKHAEQGSQNVKFPCTSFMKASSDLRIILHLNFKIY